MCKHQESLQKPIENLFFHLHSPVINSKHNFFNFFILLLIIEVIIFFFVRCRMLAKQVESNGNADSNIVKKYTPVDPSILSAATTSSTAAVAPINELESNFGSEIETYKDERGRVRVSRSRGLGIRMTRDIQRNLDFIKEYEQEGDMGEDSSAMEDTPSVEANDLTTDISLSRNEAMEISFSEDPEEEKDSIDDIFLHIAAGVSPNKEPVVSDDSEDIWEDGIVGETGAIGKERDGKKENDNLWIDNSSEGDDVDWEDGASEMHVTVSNSRSEPAKVSKGAIEEEALVQEAIRRSLEESVVREPRIGKCDDKIGSNIPEEKDCDKEEVDWEEGTCHSPINATISLHEEQDSPMQEAITRSLEDLGREKSSTEMAASTDAVTPGQICIDTDIDPVESRGGTYSEERHNEEIIVEGTPNVSDVSIDWKLSEPNIEKLQGRAAGSRSNEVSPEFLKQQQADELGNMKGPLASSDLGPISEIGVSFDSNQFDKSSQGPVSSSDLASTSDRGVHEFNRTSDSNQSFVGLNGNNNIVKENAEINLVSGMAIGGDVGVSNPTMVDATDENLMDDLNTISDANLQEEISLLRQEQAELGHERRKLESHAEAVSSEMFAECQVVICT